MATFESLNPVFTKFATLPKTAEHGKGGASAEPNGVAYFFNSSKSGDWNKPGETDYTPEHGAELLEKLSAVGAKMGYGIGYAGTPQAVAGNILYDGPDVPMHTPFAGIPWGRAVLCKKEVVTGSTNAEVATAINLIPLGATDWYSGRVPTETCKIFGTCYGTTIKDSSIQLNCGLSVGDLKKDADSTIQGGITINGDLVIAVFANASQKSDGSWEIGVGDTLIAVSDAIDPTVFQLNSSDTMGYKIPAAVGGFTFTARGTLARAPFVAHVPTYTSFNDKVSSFPTSQAILAAKV
jgi:hypothetical protein